MCNCCFVCTGYVGRKFSRQKGTEEQEILRKERSRKLFSSVAAILCGLYTFEGIGQIFLYGSCLTLPKEMNFFHTIPFGDCNERKLYFYMVLIFLAIKLFLGVLCMYGFYGNKHWKCIVPYLAIRGCFVGFYVVNILWGSDGFTNYEILFNIITTCTLILTWVPIMCGFMRVYEETEPILKPLTYDET